MSYYTIAVSILSRKGADRPHAGGGSGRFRRGGGFAKGAIAMSQSLKWSGVAGTTCHVLVGGLMLLACSGKAFGFAPPQVVESLTKVGLGEQIRLIGAGGLVCAILLLIPRTSLLGALATSAYWGGAICIHMAHHESYALQSVLVLLTWTGAILRSPAAFGVVPVPRAAEGRLSEAVAV
jgi:hypothetical protein